MLIYGPHQGDFLSFFLYWFSNAQVLPSKKKRLSEGFRFKKVKANKASHIISNIILIFPLPKEEQAKYIFKNYIKYLIKVL